MQGKYLFIDRDGTLIHEPLDNFQIDCIKKLSFESYVVQSLTTLKNFGYKFIIVTNQDGLGSVHFSKEKFNVPHKYMLDLFSSQGINFEEVFICPHFVYEDCLCRKPKLGMIKNFINDNLINKELSYVIGDRDTDMKFAKNMGIKGILYNKNNCNWPNIVSLITKKKQYIKIIRNTFETNIFLKLWKNKKKDININTGIDFFDHMLEQVAIHSGLCMHLIVISNLNIDDHHIVEDVSIVLGKALLKILKKKNGLKRFGFILPMDDSLAQCVIDISGRSYLSFQVTFTHQYIASLSTEMIEHFFKTISNSMKINIYLKAKGSNDHHLAESIFKAFGKTLMQAMLMQGDILPSSKGVL
ncbi:bifunctional histidinol-phosphatase/imidazoleglycerol-phosphate dehydratase HisB [Buchnera aphidicola (Mollitrichosiphum nigrofasciatum)]|uniref:bifunctional histidinol-phosphatase/imidazoleglycerol-phosphate dehydratase HisB n=1 Tax=Buchnera aphidicola TaxID=9 RepID=UPI0031B8A847